MRLRESHRDFCVCVNYCERVWWVSFERAPSRTTFDSREFSILVVGLTFRTGGIWWIFETHGLESAFSARTVRVSGARQRGAY